METPMSERQEQTGAESTINPNQDAMKKLTTDVESAFDEPLLEELATDLAQNMPPATEPRESSLIKNPQHIATHIENLTGMTTSPRLNVLKRLADSKVINFSMEAYQREGKPSQNGIIHPELNGSEVERARDGRKIDAFLRKHADLMNTLNFKPGYLSLTKELEDKNELPEGYAQRFYARSLETVIANAKRNHLDHKANAATLELKELETADIEPITDDEINSLIDTIIEKDKAEGLFDSIFI
jgi:hypothetical protein